MQKPVRSSKDPYRNALMPLSALNKKTKNTTNTGRFDPREKNTVHYMYSMVVINNDNFHMFLANGLRINTDIWVPFVGGLNVHKTHLFWCETEGKVPRVLTCFDPQLACDLLMVSPKHGWSTKAVGGGIVIQYGYAHKYVHMWIKNIVCIYIYIIGQPMT